MESNHKYFDFKKLSGKLFGSSGTTILLVIGFVGILLIFLSEFWPQQKKTSAGTSSKVASSDYACQLETKLAGIVGQIHGVGRVHVMVTIQSGVQYVYEQDRKSTADKSQNSQSDGSTQTQENDNTESSPVVVQNESGGQQALIHTEIQPIVQGVVVVCDGGDNSDVKESIVDAVTIALGIEANHVSVCKMS